MAMFARIEADRAHAEQWTDVAKGRGQ